MFRVAAACLAIALFAPVAHAAPPNVPTSLPYQGLLLDGLGTPRSGSVDLTLRIYDTLIGGVLVYKQSFPSVALADGVFTVQLGPNGEGTDAPSNPLTTSLSTALAGDAGPTAPLRFLEVTVGGDGALARTQILSSAYALRASSAASADTATQATNVSGVSGLFVSEFFEHFNADGGGPPNYDPSEGVIDTDADGILNFVDPDNDADGLPDITEVAQGSNVNLVTPIVTGVTPGSAQFSTTVGVTVNGSNFQPPLSVVFGTQTPTPTNVTPTSFDLTVGPQTPGSASVQVTNGNGETDSLANAFTWLQTLAHSVAMNPGTGLQSSIDVRTGTSFVVFSGQKQYGIGDVNAGLQIWSLATKGTSGQIATAFEASGRLDGLRCLASGTNCNVEVRADVDGDTNLEDETAIPIETAIGTNALLNAATLRFDPSGRRVAAYQRSDGATSTAMVAHDHNGDGDFVDANELLTVGTVASTAVIASALAIDTAGRVAYVRGAGAVLAAWDRNGDGDFADTVGTNAETSTVVGGVSPTCVGATFDSADRLAIVYGNAGVVTLLRDLDADGDFGDAGESTILIGASGNFCDVDWRAGQPLTAAYRSGNNAIEVKMDKNDDGDFADAGEVSGFAAASSLGLRLRLNGTNAGFIGYQGSIAIAPTN